MIATGFQPGDDGAFLGLFTETLASRATARALGMSYRRAWVLVDTMNRCFRKPLVTTATGGITLDVAAGRLLPVLEDANPGDLEEVHAVFLGQGGYLPLRVRAFLDFLVETVDLARPLG